MTEIQAEPDQNLSRGRLTNDPELELLAQCI